MTSQERCIVTGRNGRCKKPATQHGKGRCWEHYIRRTRDDDAKRKRARWVPEPHDTRYSDE